MVDRTRCASLTLVILGIGFVIGAVLLFALGGQIIDSSVRKGCELVRGTPTYKVWHDPPIPLHLSFYVFNLLNADLLNNSAIPIVQEIGPFVYQEVRNKSDVEEYENGTISYRESRYYEFVPSLSVSDANTTYITTMNLVYMTLVNLLQMKSLDRQVELVIGGFLNYEEKPTINLTVHQLLWGYEDRLLRLLKKAIPPFIDSDVVSVFNASVSQAGLNVFLINNGVDVTKTDQDRIKKVGNIEGFNGQSTVSYWSTAYANMINGTDSTLWHPGTTTDDQIYTFISDICRSLRLEYHEERTNAFNIDNYRFTLPANTFTNSENRDFCLNIKSHNETHEHCLPDGLMSLQTCIKLSGSSIPLPLPIIASFPHFLDASPSVQNDIQGLQPDEVKHRSFMDIEPLTGTVMNGSRRMQINLNVVNDSAIRLISKYRSFVYPMIWLNEHAEIDKTRADEFNSAVSTPIMILAAVKYSLLVVGIVLFLIVVIIIVRSYHKKNTTGSVFPPPPDETSPLCT